MPEHDAVADDLLIGGIVPFSTVDWPERLVCVCFLAGCPWRCTYCQNRMLWDSCAATSSWAELYSLLSQRHGLLDGVVFSGGEPLAQPGLLDAAQRVRAMNYEVGVHTGGAYPDRLKELLPYLDWVGFDVKAPWNDYRRLTHAGASGRRAWQSLQVLLASGVDMEVRTTWHPDLLSGSDITQIATELSALGVRRWAIQAYRSQGTDGSLPERTVCIDDVPDEARDLFPDLVFRDA